MASSLPDEASSPLLHSVIPNVEVHLDAQSPLIRTSSSLLPTVPPDVTGQPSGVPEARPAERVRREVMVISGYSLSVDNVLAEDVAVRVWFIVQPLSKRKVRSDSSCGWQLLMRIVELRVLTSLGETLSMPAMVPGFSLGAVIHYSV